jgi:tetratricopeptide (TPR) repeat protein
MRLVVLLFGAAFACTAQETPDQLYQQASAAYDRGEITKAISLYEQLLKLQPSLLQARVDLGVALVHEGRYNEGIAQYEEVLRRESGNSPARLDLALAWYKQGEFGKAAGELETLRRDQPRNTQALYLLADCYLRLGRNTDVVSLLQPIYDSNPEDLAVDYALGTALLREGRINDGEVVVDRILKKGDSAEANLLLGEAQFGAGDYQKAAETLRRSTELNASIPEAWSLYGRALLHNDDSEGAKTAFTNALKQDPNNFEANLYMGSLLRGQGNANEAVPYVERAYRLRPNSPETRFQMAALEASTGKLEQAREKFEGLERDFPDFLEVHLQLARLYARMNLKADSNREQEIVVRLNEKERQANPKQTQ